MEILFGKLLEKLKMIREKESAFLCAKFCPLHNTDSEFSFYLHKKSQGTKIKADNEIDFKIRVNYL